MKSQLFRRIVSSLLVVLMMSICIVGCDPKSGSLSGNGISGSGKDDLNKVILTVDKYDVTLEEFYIYAIQYLFNNETVATAIDDKVYEEIVSAIEEEIKVESVEYQLAKVTDGVEFTDEDLKKADNTADYFYNYFGKAFFDNYGISKDKVHEVFQNQMYIELLKDKALDDICKDYSDEFTNKYKDLPFISIYYILFPRVKYDAEGNPMKGDDGQYLQYTDEEMKESLKKANEALEKARGYVEAGEKDGNLEQLASEYGVDYCSGIEHNYEGAYSEELNTLLKGLKDGDISDVVETDAGYMIVRMDNSDDKDFKDYSIKIMAEKSAEAFFPTLQSNWLSASGVKDIKIDRAMLNKNVLTAICQEMNDNGFSISNGGSN